MRCNFRLLFTTLIALSACSFPIPPTPDFSGAMERVHLWQQLMKEPDMPSWYLQREKVVQAIGDRVYDKGFDQVFNALVVALPAMGAEVANMERQSGYISARGTILPPDAVKALRHEGLVEYCRHHNYDPSLLNTTKNGFDVIDPDMMGGVMQRQMTAITITLVKQGDNQTKVKVRFTGMYYPKLVLSCISSQQYCGAGNL